eukprot:35703-Prorocentrum_minimum.AAC.3
MPTTRRVRVNESTASPQRAPRRTVTLNDASSPCTPAASKAPSTVAKTPAVDKKFRGVVTTVRKTGTIYTASIRHQGILSPLGTFDSAEAAARAYDLAAIKYKGRNGSTSFLNFDVSNYEENVEDKAEVAAPVEGEEEKEEEEEEAAATGNDSNSEQSADSDEEENQEDDDKGGDDTADVDSEDSEEDESDDEDALLRALSTAMRCELAAEAGPSKRGVAAGPSTIKIASSSGKGSKLKGGDGDDDEAIVWKPELDLPQPIDIADGETGEDVLLRAHGRIPSARVRDDRKGKQPAVVIGREAGLAAKQFAPPRDKAREAKEARKLAPDTAGKGWFDMPAQDITPELKRDLRLLKLRGTWDPKRFYKSNDSSKFPKYFQIGTVVEGATEFYSSRLTRKERKQTITEEVMSNADITNYRKRRYNAVHDESQYWAQKRKKAAGKGGRFIKKRNRGARGNH